MLTANDSFSRYRHTGVFDYAYINVDCEILFGRGTISCHLNWDMPLRKMHIGDYASDTRFSGSSYMRFMPSESHDILRTGEKPLPIIVTGCCGGEDSISIFVMCGANALTETM